jgi:hypothetical protein
MGMLLNALETLVIGAVGAGLGWVTLEFFARPVRGFFDLRRRVRIAMLRFEEDPPPMTSADVSPGHDSTARTIFRDLSAELISFGQSEGLAAYFVSRLGFKPVLAGRLLAKLGLKYGTVAQDHSANYPAILEALKFKRD